MPIDVKQVLKDIGKAVLEIAIDVNTFYEKMNKIEAEWQKTVAKFKDIGKTHEIKDTDRQSVVTLFDAKQAIEDLRVENLVAHVKEIFQTVENKIELVLFLVNPSKHGGIGGKTEGGLPVLSPIPGRAAQFVFQAEQFIQGVFQAMDAVATTIDAIGQIIDLLDIFKAAEDKLEEKALGKQNRARYISVKFRFRSRVPSVRGEEGLEAAKKGTTSALNFLKFEESAEPSSQV